MLFFLVFLNEGGETEVLRMSLAFDGLNEKGIPAITFEWFSGSTAKTLFARKTTGREYSVPVGQ